MNAGTSRWAVRRGVSVAAWSLAVTLAVIGILAVVLEDLVLRAGQSTGGGPPAVTLTVPAVAYLLVGALVASRQPRNAIGWIMMGVGGFQALNIFAWSYAIYALLVAPGRFPLGPEAIWLGQWMWAPSLGLVVTFLLLLLPDGRLPSRGWRWLALVSGLALAYTVAVPAVGSWRERGVAMLDPNAAWTPLVDLLFLVGVSTVALCGLGSVTSLIVRFRSAAGVERQQLKWVACGGAVSAAGVVLVWFVNDDAGVLPHAFTSSWFLAMPACVGVAVFRYRLYEIDRLISRTVSYAALTGVLGAMYSGGVVLLGTLLRPLGADSDLAVAGSTLAVAAVFGPARRRVQAVVDRRFNRERYDAERTVEALRARLRDEVDLDQLSAELLAAVHQTVQPVRASLWLQPARSGR